MGIYGQLWLATETLLYLRFQGKSKFAKDIIMFI